MLASFFVANVGDVCLLLTCQLLTSQYQLWTDLDSIMASEHLLLKLNPVIAKPFVKWVGGKRKVIPELLFFITYNI